MKILKTVQKVPGGVMIIPLLLGVLLNTIDELQISWIVNILKSIGVSETENGTYEFLQIGGFSQALFKDGVVAVMALFLFCVGSQMNLKTGGKSLKKGTLLLSSKYLAGLSIGMLVGFTTDPMTGFLGLSTVAIIAGMTNGNGGLYAALTGEYGNRSDVGGLSVVAINDGPFFTLISLGLLGASFPFVTFISVLLPVLIGMILGNLDEDIRAFLKPGEVVTVPFFAFALGTGMSFSVFLNLQVVAAGILLGLMTTIFTGFAGVLAFKLFKEKSYIGPFAEASTAGNAAATPAAVAVAATVSGAAGTMSAVEVQAYHDLVNVATAQISVSVMVTSLMCPIAVMMVDKYQRKKGIIGTEEDELNDPIESDTQSNQVAK